MSDIVIVAVVASVPGALSAIATMVLGVLQYRTHSAVGRIEKNTNGLTEALVKVTGESEYAKGKLEGEGDKT